MNINQFSYEILETIKDAGRGIGEFLITPYGTLSLHPRSSYYSAFKRLEKQKLISKERKGRVNCYSLTRKGRILLSKKQKRVKRSDGYSTIVIFDIPEEKRRQRTIFRRYLKRNGYSLLQKSVFISPDHPLAEIKDIIHELKISGYVTLLSSKVENIP